MLASVSSDLPWAIGLIEGILIGVMLVVGVQGLVLVVQWARGRG